MFETLRAAVKRRALSRAMSIAVGVARGKSALALMMKLTGECKMMFRGMRIRKYRAGEILDSKPKGTRYVVEDFSNGGPCVAVGARSVEQAKRMIVAALRDNDQE